jgi:hypothetical protein
MHVIYGSRTPTKINLDFFCEFRPCLCYLTMRERAFFGPDSSDRWNFCFLKYFTLTSNGLRIDQLGYKTGRWCLSSFQLTINSQLHWSSNLRIMFGTGWIASSYTRARIAANLQTLPPHFPWNFTVQSTLLGCCGGYDLIAHFWCCAFVFLNF